MGQAYTIKVALSSFSFSEFSINLLISDLSVKFSPVKAWTRIANSSASAWREREIRNSFEIRMVVSHT